MRGTLFCMPRAKSARGKVRGALPRDPRQGGYPPETPRPLSLGIYVPERSSPSRVRSGKSFQTRKRFPSAAHNARALDGCGPFRRLAHHEGKRANAKPFCGSSGLPLVGPELHDNFGVDKPS
jgi:hypothetical protein